MTMAKYCPKCNDLLDEKYSFCLGCGNEIGAEKRPFQGL
jgi:RNA polymerase-binding transcription factor DksA